MPARPRLLEIAANSVASAVAAAQGGADRIELCAALEVGGLTPSAGLVSAARDAVDIPVYVLVRPRAGDFLYDDGEFDTMLRDVEACAALGCDGVVVGMLDADGGVDMARCRALVRAAGAMGVTFHRAIDVSRDPLETLDRVIELGFERVLSSGGHGSAPAGVDVLATMVERAAGRIIVMPGAGVNAGNISQLGDRTGAREFHASAKRGLPSGMRHVADPALGMSQGESRSDVEEIRRLVAALHGG